MKKLCDKGCVTCIFKPEDSKTCLDWQIELGKCEY